MSEDFALESKNPEAGEWNTALGVFSIAASEKSVTLDSTLASGGTYRKKSGVQEKDLRPS